MSGVTVHALDEPHGTQLDLDADLVVDAAGRASRLVTWLEEFGHDRPAETHVDPDIAYACRLYRIPERFSQDWQVAMLFSKPPTMPRSGFLYPVENGLWSVALMGAAGQHPPTHPAGFAAFARSLRHPVIADAIAQAEPVTPVYGHRGTANRLLHVERSRRWPERLVVLGDAVCAFNPVYGQGMTIAAVAAETLDRCLRDQSRRDGDGDLDGFARRFQRRLARANADPWMLSTGEDLRFPTTTGARVTTATRMQHRYLDRVLAAATCRPAVADAYMQVVGMLARPSSLFAPRIVAAAARTSPAATDGPPPPAPDRRSSSQVSVTT